MAKQENFNIVCKICQSSITNYISLAHHVFLEHGINSRYYFENYLKKEGDGFCKKCGNNTNYISLRYGYAVWCSAKCRANDEDHKINLSKVIPGYGTKGKETKQNRRKKEYKSKIRCKLCDLLMISMKGLASHLNKNHVIESKVYYDQYLIEQGEGYCLNKDCGKPTIFKNISFGYYKYCNKDCQHSDINYRLKIQKIHKGRKYSEAARIKNEESGRWVKNNEKEAFNAYHILVARETKKHIEDLFKNWNGECYYIGDILTTDKDKSNDQFYATIDHKISIKYGFENNINPYYIGSLENLCVCGRQVNIVKKDLTEEQFLKILRNENIS